MKELKKYKIYSSQIVYHVVEVEAENEEQAGEIAFKDDLDWKWFDYGEWCIDEIEEIKP